VTVTSAAASAPLVRDRLDVWRRRAVVANLVAQVLIIVTGGLVRLTASGLGCSSWPSCEPGHFTPTVHDATSYHPFIEFGNRTITGVLVVVSLAVALLVGLDRRRSASYRTMAWVPLVGVVVQAVVGGMAVLYQLPPAVVSSHMLLSMVLVAVSTWLVVRSRESDAVPTPVVDAVTRRLVAGLGVAAVAVVALGVVVTGAGPHSGDDRVGYRFAVDPFQMARVHSLAVWIFVALLVAVLLRLRRTGPTAARRAAWLLLAVTAAQALIGYVQLFTGLPIALVDLHMLGAAALVVAVVLLAGTLRTRGPVPALPAPGPQPAAAARAA
jgi:cytochrome c oxidase assembly protein subunit 15